MEEGKIVAEYQFQGCLVRISDSAFAHKAQAEIERDRLYARQTACRILQRIMAEHEGAGGQ